MIYTRYLSLNVLYLLIIFIGNLFFEVESFTPLGREGHSSVLVGNKLYFFGGFNGNDLAVYNQVFYLDVSKRFNVLELPWVDVALTTPTAAIPFGSAYGTAVVGNINKEPTIYLFGGLTRDMNSFEDSFSSVLYSFNLNTLQWKPEVTGKEQPARRRDVKSVIDNTGKIYIFCGIADKSLNSTIERFFNEILILNTADFTWATINSPNSNGTIFYTATLLPNGMIVYIGGMELNAANFYRLVGISKINLYNTNSSTWASKTAKLKDSIEDRYSHTAVLIPDGKIIIYGGGRVSNVFNNTKVTPDLAVLNTNTEPFEWTVPRVSSNVGTVPSLTAHTADLVGNYMIVSFGNVTLPNANPLGYNPNIYVMDIGSYTWVNTFDNNDKKLTIIIVTISVIIGIAVLIGLGFLVHKRNKRKKEEDALTVKYNNVTTVNNSSYNRDVTIVNNNP